jgi:hypothetical protein
LLLERGVEVAFAQGSAPAIDRALGEISRSRRGASALGDLEGLARGAIAARTSAGEQALDLLDAVPPFADPALERARAGGALARRAARAAWLGRLRFRQGRFDESAALHAEAAAGERLATARIAAEVNAAMALVEASSPAWADAPPSALVTPCACAPVHGRNAGTSSTSSLEYAYTSTSTLK